MKISPEVLALLTLLLRIVQVLLVPILLWMLKQIFALRRDIEELRGKVGRNEDRLKSLPDNNALHQLALGFEGLRGDVRTVGARIGGLEQVVNKMDSILDRQESFLLNGGGSKK